tara:strand:- start:183 stop:593 length:411 start_codon:yes stop_codon:yes gene_type:complete
MEARKITKKDFETITSWYKKREWPLMSKDFLPDNGEGGLIISHNKIDIVAGFIWFSNSKISWFGFPISDPDYKEDNKNEAIDMLITCAEQVCKKQGSNIMFTYLNHDSNYNKGIEKYEKLGWNIKEKSTTMLKIIN